MEDGGLTMAYDLLPTENENGFAPGGLHGYGASPTKPTAGFRPGLGAVGPIGLTIGPGGQWAVSAGSQPTATSLWDQIQLWLAGSTFVPGMPNSVFAIGAGLVLFAGVMKRRR